MSLFSLQERRTRGEVAIAGKMAEAVTTIENSLSA
jgi:hypothetical protein